MNLDKEQSLALVKQISEGLGVLSENTKVIVSPSAKIAVVGPGRLGLLVAQVLRLVGAVVTVFGRSDSALMFARSYGLTAMSVEQGADNMYDFVVEATGNPEGFAHSMRLVKPQGTIVLKSTFARKEAIDLTKIVVAEITVVGSRCGPFAPALSLLEQGKVDVKSLIEAEYSLSQGKEAFEHAARPGAKKIIIKP